MCIFCWSKELYIASTRCEKAFVPILKLFKKLDQNFAVSAKKKIFRDIYVSQNK